MCAENRTCCLKPQGTYQGSLLFGSLTLQQPYSTSATHHPTPSHLPQRYTAIMAPSRNSRRESVTSLEKRENGSAGHESAAAGSISTVVMAKSATELAPSMEVSLFLLPPSICVHVFINVFPQQLADVFKADLDNIKSLVTCTICDQLLYEPWMLACGHTYCYSVCL